MNQSISPSKRVRALEGLLRKNGLGETLRRPQQVRHPPVPSGIEDLDARLGGGLPRGAISEITGRGSSGRTGLLFGVLARVTQGHEIAAYVDATDCLDPRSAQEVGVSLERLLWIRCGEAMRASRWRRGQHRGDEAWRATNLVVSAGSFGVVAVDLGGLTKRRLGRWQRHPWMRLKHAVEGSTTALVVLAERPVTGSAAGLVLELRRERTDWDGLLAGFDMHAEVVRNRVRGLAGGAARQGSAGAGI